MSDAPHRLDRYGFRADTTLKSEGAVSGHALVLRWTIAAGDCSCLTQQQPRAHHRPSSRRSAAPETSTATTTATVQLRYIGGVRQAYSPPLTAASPASSARMPSTSSLA
ncbi:protein of unknown function [Modestobacter italicus]|uniref:Uncharacterized protein n=1 Tax=Modestobacter italicus (strain DSM 44449 / CECT 9708 / BC 501) TaxID=2732864 RepID=I4F0K0_MODI5|nr:protein of unknown function [Modestobacter marinus]